VHAFLGPEGHRVLLLARPPATGRVLACHQPSAVAAGVGTAVAGGPGRRLADGRLRSYDLAWLAYFGLQHRHAARYRAGRIYRVATSLQPLGEGLRIRRLRRR
jgi:hypothetical protein